MQRRPPLYYALEQRWGLEKLSWLVDKSVGTAYEKDLDGLSLVTHARKNACPEELVIRLAVAAASHCILALDELLHGHHCESARRSQHEERNDDRATRCEDERARIADEQRTFSPYFYVVEMATFSPTFWRRYDQTWWFDKTKTNVIDGMYKVVHRGFEMKATMSRLQQLLDDLQLDNGTLSKVYGLPRYEVHDVIVRLSAPGWLQ
ncbi:uncharacterized protein PITG_01730 [Phytophthora infestans T30-4]|uniref:Uncharacterized protein n=1 Tax=Phytophthora infestans (strain T30-4) TaxID=403677 RepID=D0MTY5_PHYIT|nr:uncharacterized protein PITG_01730 [Phytophthora infestans T30-4]EEY61432.1 hypothetical protein PITG_01730 [Phytophthora infestans T30-4]|eukprot:XP_002908349.1 hypothetical protein PITG_01730 [Phytophthora infestans T30-4]